MQTEQSAREAAVLGTRGRSEQQVSSRMEDEKKKKEYGIWDPGPPQTRTCAVRWRAGKALHPPSRSTSGPSRDPPS
jgi:hypothetical protein